MILVEDLWEYGDVLPEEFIELIPSVCPSCGSPMGISLSLTGLRCTNKACSDKLTMRIKAICNKLGILNFGESTIEKFLDTYEIDSPLDILGLHRGMDLYRGATPEASLKVISQIEQHRNFLLWEYVQLANLPNIQTSAMAIFKGYSSLEEAYIDIESGGVAFIQSRLGINGNKFSIKSAQIYDTLIEYKNELFSAIGYVNIVKPADIELNIVCSDQVGGRFHTKNEFYSFVKDRYKGKAQINFLSSVKKSIDFLVWAGADGSPARHTSKVAKVEKYNEQGVNIPIVTAEQFIGVLDEKLN